MSGLRLGDLILDPRRVIFVPSLRAVVCAGLHDGLQVGISGGLRSVLERIDSVLEEYKPESLVVLGLGSSGESAHSAITGIARRWGKLAKIHLVAGDPDPDMRELAEGLGFEVHHELIWGRYRFVDSVDMNALELQLLTIAGAPHYAIKVGNLPFSGMRLAVFLKGLGRITLPSISPRAPANSIYRPGLDRFDVFAVGHQRVLPMGKVGDLKPITGIGRGLPIAKATLGAHRRAQEEPSAD